MIMADICIIFEMLDFRNLHERNAQHLYDWVCLSAFNLLSSAMEIHLAMLYTPNYKSTKNVALYYSGRSFETIISV